MSKSTDSQEELTCPFCGFEEMNASDEAASYGSHGTTICGECGKEFAYEVEVAYYFSTFIPKEDITASS